ncbi:phosphoribosylanthranilate isomerase [Salsuginibacillus kocurii]|uniref:phosphoribosylanthranilate isomerase n=1 Tax=Salsuginibacillus kocurii TaxID=427078 RepID=UPI000369C58B|nr:phosphoribosylanthranilate isomerase [Salsuginibacillus kocurii]
MSHALPLKICGLHHEEDVKHAVTSSAAFLGFVFAKSRRQVQIAEVKQWLQLAGPVNTAKIAALFVHPKIEDVVEVVEELPVSMVQLHGKESPEFVKEVKERTRLEVFKALHHDPAASSLFSPYEGIADGFIVDTKVDSAWGGTGQTFDWSYVPFYKKEAERLQVPVLIAGGVTPDNISQLLSYDPPGIDISSGLERNGKKCSAKIEQLEKRLVSDDEDIPRQ